MSMKGSAYGKAAGDTDFRKKYDLENYAARAKARETDEAAERKARYEAKLEGKKYYKPPTGDETLTQARDATRNFNHMIGKSQLVPAGAGTGKRGRGAGFYCEACDLTFKDSKQLVDHQNSMQHLQAIGHTGEVRRATVEEVRVRIEAVWERLQRRKEEEIVNLQRRLEVRREEDEREREEKRRKRREAEEKRRKEREEAAKVKMEYGEDVRIEGEHDEDDMMAAMGFTGFGTTSKK